MANDIYVVTGATGNIGKKLVQKLAAAGKQVRAVARSADKVKGKNIEPFKGSVEDADAMTRAFAGAKVVFLLIPPKYDAPDFRAYQNKVSEAFAKAITANKVPYVVDLSSVGAQLPQGVGPVSGLHENEERLNKLQGVNVLHLRATFFMENHLFGLAVIKQAGFYGTALKADTKIPQIATEDIAEEAAQRMLKLDFTGHSVKELLGPRDFTMAEVTQILGKAIGKPDLKYVQFPYEDTRKAIEGMGFSKDVAKQFIEMYEAMNEGRFRPTETRSARNTTKTSLEEFAHVLAAAFNSSN